MVQKAARPRGRPRAYDPDTALASALGAFWDAGYAATSLDDLSAATGMNRPSLYGAFGDKRALYAAALERYRALARTSIDDALGRDEPLAEALRRLYDRAVSTYTAGESGARGCFLISTAVTEAVRHPEVREALQAALQEIDDAIERRIRSGITRGEVDPAADPATLARLASGIMHSLAIRARAGEARSMLDAMAQAGLALVVAAAAPKRATARKCS